VQLLLDIHCPLKCMSKHKENDCQEKKGNQTIASFRPRGDILLSVIIKLLVNQKNNTSLFQLED
jgi:hypothetical protein